MKKAIVLAIAMVMAFCIGIGSTLAYLFVDTDPVVNTFAYGDINIELKEHKYENGALTTTEVTSNTNYKVIPGVTEPKDPFVTVLSGSEECYVYVTVENTVKIDGTIVATPNIDTTNWIKVIESGDKTLYRYKEVVDASAAAVTLPNVFTEVTYSTTITKDKIAQVKDKTITVWAYAHQSQKVEQSVADTAATTWFNGLDQQG